MMKMNLIGINKMKYLISFVLSCLLLIGCTNNSDFDFIIPSTTVTPGYGAIIKAITVTHENHSYVVFYQNSQTLFVIHNPDCECYETLDR